MQWSVATDVRNQSQYTAAFKPIFEFSKKGVIEKNGNSNVQVGALSDPRQTLNETNCKSLAIETKTAIKNKRPDLRISGNVNVYIFHLKENIYYVLGTVGLAIKIDSTVEIKKDGEELFSDQIETILYKLNDVNFAQAIPITVHACNTDVNEEIVAGFNFIISHFDNLKSDSAYDITVQNEEIHLSSLISDDSKATPIFLKNIEKYGSKNRSILLVAAGFTIGSILLWGYNWHQSSLEAEALANAKRAEAARIRADQLSAALDKKANNSPQPDQIDQYRLLKQERLNNEVEWIRAFDLASGQNVFTQAGEKIRNTLVEVNGWKTKHIQVVMQLDPKDYVLTANYSQSLVRENDLFTVNDLVGFYPNAASRLDGNSAVNTTKVSIELDPKKWKAKQNKSSILDVISKLQFAQHSKVIDSWSIRQEKIIPPTLLSERYLELKERYEPESSETDTPVTVNENSWISNFKAHRLIVSGKNTSVISQVSELLVHETNLMLESVKYDPETSNTVIEAIIHERK